MWISPICYNLDTLHPSTVTAMLSSLHIENFKGIKEGTISDLAQVNVLVGRNNSGKSTVLDALLLMRCAFAVTDYLGNDGVRQIASRKIHRESRDGSPEFRQLHHMLKTHEPIRFCGDFGGPAHLTEQWDAPGMRVNIRVDGPDGTYQNNNVSVGPGISVETYRGDGRWQNVAKHLGETHADLMARSHLVDPATLRSPFPETVWERIVVDRRDRRLRDMVNEIYGLDVEGFSLMPFGGHVRLVALLPEHSVAVDWLGDGLRYGLNILALGMLLEGTILMVEEPETHQHPESLKLLTRTLFELAKRQNLQLVVTTHSWEFMTCALEAAEEKDVGLAFHHTRLNDKGIFDVRSIPQPDAKLLMDIGHDIRGQDKYLRAT